MGQSRIKRILLKLSGEALQGVLPFGIDPQVLSQTVKEIAAITELEVQVGLVIGGGNLFRGSALSATGLSRVTGDQMGMLATVMNALAIRDALEQINLQSRVMSAIPVGGLVDQYSHRKTMYHLRERRVVIFAAGTGNPFFTTDSAGSLRAIEMEADVLIKATKVDGVYSADPEVDPKAERFTHLTYDEVLQRGLQVMDTTAICLCRDYQMPIQVFNMHKKGALKNLILGLAEGTRIDGGK